MRLTIKHKYKDSLKKKKVYYICPTLTYPSRKTVRPCQIGILLSVNSSFTNLGTYSQKHKTENENTCALRQK